jgi:hypothetical protein
MPSNVTVVAGCDPVDFYLGNYTYANISAGMAALKFHLATDLNRMCYKNAAGLTFKILNDASTTENTPVTRLFYADANGAATSSPLLVFNGSDLIVGGDILAENIQLTAGAVDGYYLRSDENGIGSWAAVSASQVYKGTWNATTNTPTLANGSGTAGWYYRCTVAGTVDFGAGDITFAAGDDAYYNGSVWEKIPAASAAHGVSAGYIGYADTTTTWADSPMYVSGDNIGIGIVPVSAKLHVYSNQNSTNESNCDFLLGRGKTDTYMNLYMGVNQASKYCYIGSVEWSQDYRLLALQPNGGNVTVGTNTLSDVKFTVASTVYAGINRSMFLENKYDAANVWNGSSLSFGYYATNENYSSRIIGLSNAAVTYATRLQLQTHSSVDGVFNYGMMINETGYVGIGIDPKFSLDVNGNFRLLNSAYFGDGASRYVYIDAAATTNNCVMGIGGTSLLFGTLDNAPIIFAENNVERMRLTGGNFGIGTTAPDTKLHVETESIVSGQNNDTSVEYLQRLTHTSNGSIDAGFGVGCEFELEDSYGMNRIVGSITASWGASLFESEMLFKTFGNLEVVDSLLLHKAGATFKSLIAQDFNLNMLAGASENCGINFYNTTTLRQSMYYEYYDTSFKLCTENTTLKIGHASATTTLQAATTNINGDIVYVGSGAGVPAAYFYTGQLGWNSGTLAPNTPIVVSDAAVNDGYTNLITSDGAGRWTIQKAGTYEITYSASIGTFYASTGVDVWAAVRVNSGYTTIARQWVPADSVNYVVGGVVAKTLSVGDTVELALTHTHAGSIQITASVFNGSIKMVGG